jgi:uncharacterized membrane protein
VAGNDRTDRTFSMYEWLKAFHIIAVIAWMAGMLYLPRLFVYHCAADVGSMQSETFKIMERRLLKAIINPAMIAGGCGRVPGSLLDPAAASGLKPPRRFPCLDLRTF